MRSQNRSVICWLVVCLVAVTWSLDNDLGNEIPQDDVVLARVRTLLRQSRTGDLDAMLSSGVLDPAPLEPFNVSSRTFLTDVQGSFSGLQLHGLRGFRVERLSADLGAMNLSAEFSVPVLAVVGDYFLDGTVAFVPISGEGPFYMNLTDIVLKGHSVVSASEGGRLKMGEVLTDSEVGHIALHFDNLMGGGAWGSLSNSLLNQLSELILGELKPSLLRELSSYLRHQFDELLSQHQLPPGLLDASTSSSLVDAVLEHAGDFLARRGLEPLPLPDYREAYERNLLFVTTRGQFDAYNGTLRGLSTLSRRGSVVTTFANSTLSFEAGFEFGNLSGDYLWRAGALGADLRGRMAVQVRAVDGFIRITQELRGEGGGGGLELTDLRIDGVRHVWLDVQGLGSTWDLVAESVVNLVANGLKLQLADAIAGPVRDAVQAQLEQLSI